MKANRKFLAPDDDGVSPVIAVILMVAITVVLAATVYVWVSGFGAAGSQPAKSVSLSSSGGMSTNSTAAWKNYTVSAATPGMRYSEISLTLNGAALSCASTEASADTWRVWNGGSVVSCSGTGPTQTVTAGDIVEVYDDGGSLSGKTLRVLDSQANSVILTLVVG